MRTDRRFPRSALLLALLMGSVAALGLTSCGADEAQPAPARTEAPAHAAPEARMPASDASTRVTSRQAAREVLDAARASETMPRIFSTRLAISGGGYPDLDVQIDGAGHHNATSAIASGVGLARLAVMRTSLAIVNDHLYARRGASWFDLGSASGVQLDVGRELLTHPTLTRVTRARRLAGGELRIAIRVDGAALRAYASDERSGPVTDFLARAKALTLSAVVDDGRVVADTFQLVVAGATPGSRLTVRGETRTSFDAAARVDIPSGGEVRLGSLEDLLLPGNR